MLESLELRNDEGVVTHLVSELLLLFVCSSDLLKHALALLFDLLLDHQVLLARVSLHSLFVVSVRVTCELPDEDAIKFAN